MHCSVIEQGITSLTFETEVQKNEAKVRCFVQFENEMVSYLALQLHKAQLPIF